MESNLDNFLVKVDKIKQEAKDEITNKANRMEVTALHGKYLGPKGILQHALRGFVPKTETEQDLSKHAISQAKDEIRTTCLDKVKQITRLEQSV